jgi:nucleoside-diphosphate-sugar epimerase
MKVLVTGRNGFIARHLLPRLGDHEICTTGREDDLVQILHNFKPELIFHLGAELSDESKMFNTNVVQTLSLLEWLRINTSTKLIMFGSSSEYGRSMKPMAETDALKPDTIYEGTKAAAAMLARSWSKTWGLKVTLIRPFTIYGPDEKANKFSQILFRKYQDKSVLQLTEGVHDYMYVDDFVDATLRVAFWEETDNYNVVNIGSGAQKTNAEFTRAFQKEIGYTYPIELTENPKPYDSNNWVADISVLTNKYGFEVRPFEHGLKRLVVFFKNGGENN